MVKKNVSDSGGLTRTTRIGRAFVKYGVITLVILMVGRVTLTAFVAFWNATHPKPPPPPTEGFGKLPGIEFPTQTAADKPKSYKLETPTGTLPYFGDRSFVFFMPKRIPSLLDTENAKKIASAYGFTSDPEVLSTENYRWRRTQSFNITFEYNILTNNFSYQTDFLNHPELLLNTDLPSDFDAVQQVKQFLNSGGLLPYDVASSSGQITYLKALGGTLKPAVSLSDADFVQVDINRTPINNIYPLYTPDGTTGTIHAIITGSGSGNNILRISRQYFPVDYSLSETYPIKTPQTAWQTLQAGEGYIANKGKADQAVIRSVEFGFFDSFEYQQYLQPIYVFKGDDDFIGYVSAIDSRFILPTTSTSTNSSK